MEQYLQENIIGYVEAIRFYWQTLLPQLWGNFQQICRDIKNLNEQVVGVLSPESQQLLEMVPAMEKALPYEEIIAEISVLVNVLSTIEIEDEQQEHILDYLKNIKENLNQSASALRRIAQAIIKTGLASHDEAIATGAAALGKSSLEELDANSLALFSALKNYKWNPSAGKFHLLFISKDKEWLKQLKFELSASNRECWTAQGLTEAEEMLSRQRMDLILVDLVLDEASRDFILELITMSDDLATLVIVTIPKLNPMDIVELHTIGVDLCLPHHYPVTVLAVHIARHLSRLSNSRRHVRQDLLTQLPNQAAFQDAFARAFAFSKRSQEPISILLLDFQLHDLEKKIENRMMADSIVKQATSTVTSVLRDSDFLARWGENEFVAYLPNTNEDGANLALQKVLRAMRVQPFRFQNDVIQVSFEGGVSEVTKDASLEEAIAHAGHLRHVARSKTGSSTQPKKLQSTPTGKPLLMNVRVLLAEDEPIISSVLKYYFEREGFDVQLVADGQAAVDAVSNHRFSLIILDVKMPKMDGFEVLQRLRGRPDLKNTPIVMLTSLGREKDIIRGFEMGASDYILKPFSPPELLVRLRRLLEIHG